MKEFILKVLIIAALFCFIFVALYVWPGVKRYEYYAVGDKAILKIDILTGHTDSYFQGKWE